MELLFYIIHFLKDDVINDSVIVHRSRFAGAVRGGVLVALIHSFLWYKRSTT